MDYIEQARVMIAEYDHQLEKIEERLDKIDDSEPIAPMIRTQLEMMALTIRQSKMEKESMLEYAKNPASAFMPQAVALPSNFDAHKVEKTCFFQSNASPSSYNIVFQMKDGSYIDPMSGRQWTLTDEWKLERSTDGIDSMFQSASAPVPGVKP